MNYRHRPRRTVSVLAAVVLVLGGCSQAEPEPDTTADLDRFYGQSVTFEPCEGYGTTSTDEAAFVSDPTFHCARVDVPLDYDDPDGRTAQIALLKAVSYTHLTLPTIYSV